MKEINKDIVKETNRLLGLCENNPAAYKCKDRAAVSNRRIDPSNGFGPLGAVVTLHSGIKATK
jgi:hypothetical protein